MTRRVSVVLVVLLSAVAAWGQFRTVTVQNAGSNPVPTTIQNTPSVNIANTPSVSVTGTPTVSITGTPSVSVSGTPTVAVSNLPTGAAGPASLAGIITKNLDEPARQPVQQSLTCSTVAAGVNTCTATYMVPAGKRLVIEYLQLISIDLSGSATSLYQITTTVQGMNVTYYYPPGPAPAGNNHISEHLVRIYADPGSTVQLQGTETSNTGTVTFLLQLSGYFIQLP